MLLAHMLTWVSTKIKIEHGNNNVCTTRKSCFYELVIPPHNAYIQFLERKMKVDFFFIICTLTKEILSINNLTNFQHFVKISAPFRVIKIVCSNCAARLPSAVSMVQLSGHDIHSVVPIVRIGSATKWEINLVEKKKKKKFKLHKDSWMSSTGK